MKVRGAARGLSRLTPIIVFLFSRSCGIARPDSTLVVPAQDVGLADENEFLTVQIDWGRSVFLVEDLIARFEDRLRPLFIALVMLPALLLRDGSRKARRKPKRTVTINSATHRHVTSTVLICNLPTLPLT